MKNEDFKDIYLKYQRFSAGVAFRLVKNRAIAEDICQEVFCSLYKLGDRLDTSNEKKLRSLIFTATVNKAKDYFKKPSVKLEYCCLDGDNGKEVEDIRNNPESRMLRIEEQKYKLLVLQKLRQENPVNYDILIKTKFYGISPDSVAEEYGITRNNVNNRNLRTKIWLAKEIRKLYGDSFP